MRRVQDAPYALHLFTHKPPADFARKELISIFRRNKMDLTQFLLFLKTVTSRIPSSRVLQRLHVDHEAITHVAAAHPLVGFGDVLDVDGFDIAGDAVRAAEVEHLLGFG